MEQSEIINIETQPKKNHKKLKQFIIIIVGIIVIMCIVLLYARYIATTGINVNEYKITDTKIPKNMHGLKIVHISDIHYGRITFEKELKKVVEQINLTKPDLVILAGDLIDKDTKLTKELTNQLITQLKNINATVGKYAIKGNHDYIFSEWDTIIKESEFIDLNDTYDTIYKNGNDFILLSGMSTNLHGSKTIEEKLSTTNEFIESLKETESPYKILVVHEPDFIQNIDTKNWNLILAGHSHNGQVRFPLIGPLFLPTGAKVYNKPYYKLSHTDLYISNGIGVSTVNFRLWNRPSFNLYRLTNY